MNYFSKEFYLNFKRQLLAVHSVFIFLFFAHSLALAQKHEILDSFMLTQNGNSVIASFSIKGGASCNGVTLERRTEGDTFYVTAGLIQGVCGGSEFTEHYSIEDDSPEYGRHNIYRLILGTQGSSTENSLQVIELRKDYNIYPQPAKEEVFIKFDNPNNDPVDLKVFALDGSEVLDAKGFNGDKIFVNASFLESGLYLFQLYFTEEKLITGKFILE